MGYNNREIEFKMEVQGTKRMSEVVRKLRGHLNERSALIGSSVDVYWSLNHLRRRKLGIKGDFVRVRCMEDGTGQMTVKEQDRNTYCDRVEIDVQTKDPRSAVDFLGHVFGDPAGAIAKSYHVFFLENNHTTVSVYQVKGDERVFIEVEATNARRAAKLLAAVTDLEPNLKPVNKSLYDLILRGKPAVSLKSIRLPSSRNRLEKYE